MEGRDICQSIICHQDKPLVSRMQSSSLSSLEIGPFLDDGKGLIQEDREERPGLLPSRPPGFLRSHLSLHCGRVRPPTPPPQIYIFENIRSTKMCWGRALNAPLGGDPHVEPHLTPGHRASQIKMQNISSMPEGSLMPPQSVPSPQTHSSLSWETTQSHTQDLHVKHILPPRLLVGNTGITLGLQPSFLFYQGDPCVGGFNTSGLIDLFKMLDKIYGFYLEKCTWPQGVACRFQRVRTLKPIQSPQVDSPCPLACTPHAGGAENQELPVPGRRKGERAKRQGKEEKEEEQRAPQRVPRQLFPQDCPACSCQAQRPAQLQDQLSVVTLDPTPPLLTPSVLHFLSWVFLVATSSAFAGWQNMPRQNMPHWHKDYFELKAI
nr:uncharacterized protein LOC106832885 isoform X2 [Equus asinus]